MRQLVDEYDVGMPAEDGKQVHLLDPDSVVLDHHSRHGWQLADLFGGVCTPIGLDEPDHDVGATGGPAVALVEHRVGLPHPGRCAQVDPQCAAPRHHPSLRR
jgi:hypothetical protein